MVRVVQEHIEYQVRCPDCLRLLAFKMDEVETLYHTDYTGSRDEIGRGIICPKCREQIPIPVEQLKKMLKGSQSLRTVTHSVHWGPQT